MNSTLSLNRKDFAQLIVDRIVQDHFGVFSIFNRKEGGGGTKLIFNTRELRIRVK